MSKKTKPIPDLFEREVTNHNHFRVAIFGSARIQKTDEVYQEVYNLAKAIGKKGFDIVTGGGPGLMEAANAGHQAATPGHNNQAHSIGLPIKLPTKGEKANRHLDLKKSFNVFSKRLDEFMFLSNIIIVMPGGIGTCLEFFYTWQLTQVKHLWATPILLHGYQWKTLIDWVKKYPLRYGYLDKEDLGNVHYVKNNLEAMKLIMKTHQMYRKKSRKFVTNYREFGK